MKDHQLERRNKKETAMIIAIDRQRSTDNWLQPEGSETVSVENPRTGWNSLSLVISIDELGLDWRK